MRRSKELIVQSTYKKYEGKEKPYLVDGEKFIYKDFVKVVCMEEEIERIVDFEVLKNNLKWFKSNWLAIWES